MDARRPDSISHWQTKESARSEPVAFAPMRLLLRLGSLRTVAALLTLSTAVQMALIAIGNITDYETNHQFVVHVFAMDTTFHSPHVMWRAITSSGLVTTAYLAIIAWEVLTAAVLVTAAVVWIRALGGRRDTDTARRLSTLGWTMWLALFAGGFLAIGGEYFEMWQSSKWNGTQSALEEVIIASFALILTFLSGLKTKTSEG
jgi:predicted small integral membrane protein